MFPGNGSHASDTMSYLEQGFQVTWDFARELLCLEGTSASEEFLPSGVNQHRVNAFT